MCFSRAVVLFGIASAALMGASGLASGQTAAPSRDVVAFQLNSPLDARNVADQIADLAKRCWRREAAFQGLGLGKIETGQKPGQFLIHFIDQRSTAKRLLRIYVVRTAGNSGLAIALEQQGAEDVAPIVRRDADLLVKGHPVRC